MKRKLCLMTSALLLIAPLVASCSGPQQEMNKARKTATILLDLWKAGNSKEAVEKYVLEGGGWPGSAPAVLFNIASYDIQSVDMNSDDRPAVRVSIDMTKGLSSTLLLTCQEDGKKILTPEIIAVSPEDQAKQTLLEFLHMCEYAMPKRPLTGTAGRTSGLAPPPAISVDPPGLDKLLDYKIEAAIPTHLQGYGSMAVVAAMTNLYVDAEDGPKWTRCMFELAEDGKLVFWNDPGCYLLEPTDQPITPALAAPFQNPVRRCRYN